MEKLLTHSHQRLGAGFSPAAERPTHQRSRLLFSPAASQVGRRSLVSTQHDFFSVTGCAYLLTRTATVPLGCVSDIVVLCYPCISCICQTASQAAEGTCQPRCNRPNTHLQQGEEYRCLALSRHTERNRRGPCSAAQRTSPCHHRPLFGRPQILLGR